MIRLTLSVLLTGFAGLGAWMAHKAHLLGRPSWAQGKWWLAASVLWLTGLTANPTVTTFTTFFLAVGCWTVVVAHRWLITRHRD